MYIEIGDWILHDLVSTLIHTAALEMPIPKIPSDTLGVIQQLRGLNFTQFWPPPPLEWTIVDILHDTQYFVTWPSLDFELVPSPSYCPQLLNDPLDYNLIYLI